MATDPRVVLIVDDEPDLRDLLTTALRYAGFDAVSVASGRAALETLADRHVDLVVMDVMMPAMDGLTAIRKLRARGDDVPVLFLTAKDEADDVVAGLRVGGDDYVTKPFRLAEVVARIEAILRRSTSLAAADNTIRVADLEIDEDAHEARRSGRVLDLTPTEFALLRHLAMNAGRVLSKTQLLAAVWGYDSGDGNLVETYVSYLRRKVDAPFDAPLVHTKRGIGYVLKDVR
ncbi:MAG: response regulator transcription factor [Demequinaceae bacterium]|nr:response regulator transcription factor [Demequinaceae bacterium]